MAYLQLLTDDSWYYDTLATGALQEIKKSLGNPPYLQEIKKILPFPDGKTIKENLGNPSIAFMSPEKLLNSSVLIVKTLPKTKMGGVKSTQQEKYYEDINSEIYNKFGITVSEPKTTFKDLGGFNIPKSDMLRTKEYITKGLIQKNLSIFLGVSRSGKSFFAECLAGELGYKLIMLDLGIIMCDANPSKKLDDFFYYLENIDNYVLLIDEIEKAADPSSGVAMAKVVIGKLLTIFNNFNSESGFKIKSNFVIATANNITDLLNKNPEFINRFGLKYFVGYPTKSDFIDICNYYIKKMRVRGILGDDIYNVSSSLYAKCEIPILSSASQHTRFGKYAAGEIKELMSNLLLYCQIQEDELFCDTAILQKVVDIQKPQIYFAQRGVINTIQAARIANFREVD
ncbi:MAG: AAA family ATPase [Sulfurimonas sp.]|uniref:AAA family ATPase n=1 Tax=Sulfurimonas sp. TaxID=2022749 RepID=UPI0026051193|nr:AAA family ATPase [Sulfurimonas sp.]MDD5373281.1 AAA family ATPase [Sulfurimonas sp.]